MLKTTAISLFLCLASGCATIYPQPRPAEPTAVYIADYGIHSSLLLPTGDGRYVEYAFGDWNFAALNHCWPQDAVGALLISFQSALGRRFIDLPPGQSVPKPTRPAPHHLEVLYASQINVDRVVRELDQRFRRDAKLVVHNPDNGMDYVKDSEHYSIANNCNHLTARCLRELGCDVRGLVMLSEFDVAPVPHELVAQSPAPPHPAAPAATMPTAKAD